LTCSNDGASTNIIICTYCKSPTLAWHYIQSQDIIKAVKDALPATGTNSQGYQRSKVGSHLLHSGGAMTLFLNGHDAFTIQQAGRWTSNTFIEYIHGQLNVTSWGLSNSMATATPFINMA